MNNYSIQDILGWASEVVSKEDAPLTDKSIASAILETHANYPSEQEIISHFLEVDTHQRDPFEEHELKELRDQFALAAFKSTILAYLIDDERSQTGYQTCIEDLPIKQIGQECYKAADEVLKSR